MRGQCYMYVIFCTYIIFIQLKLYVYMYEKGKERTSKRERERERERGRGGGFTVPGATNMFPLCTDTRPRGRPLRISGVVRGSSCDIRELRHAKL